ncbi:MAG: hypothetical protein WC807_16535 [Hyphomicrobium sp.]|jgi:hypothetical protein
MTDVTSVAAPEAEESLQLWKLNPPAVDEGRAARERERAWHRSGAETIAAMGVISATSITALMVFRGNYAEMARDHGETVATATTALAVAMGLTLCIFIGFLMAEKLTPRMSRWWTYGGAWICILLFCGWAVGTSSWYGFMSMAGAPALEMHLMASAETLDKAVSKATEQIRTARGLPGAMNAKAAGFALQSESEVKGGGATGARGAGPLSQSLEGAAAVLRTGGSEIAAAVNQADADAARMRGKIMELSELVTDRRRPVHEREAIFLKGAAELRAMIGAMHDAGLAEIAKASLAAVRSSVSSLPTGNSALGERQYAAMATIRADMDMVAADLAAVIRELDGARSEAGNLVEVVSLSDIVWKYKDRFIPALVLAVGIDLFAVWALMMLGLFGVPEKELPYAARGKDFLALREVIGADLDDEDLLKALPALSGKGGKVAEAKAGRKGRRRDEA